MVSEKDNPLGSERAEDVTALYERGMISQKAFDKGSVAEMNVGNYVEYGMSIRTPRDHLYGISVELPKSKFCDLAFARYLREGHNVIMCRLQPERILC